MDYSYYNDPRPQPFSLYGLPTPDQPNNAQPDAFVLVGSLSPYDYPSLVANPTVRMIATRISLDMTPRSALTPHHPLLRHRIHRQNLSPENPLQAAKLPATSV